MILPLLTRLGFLPRRSEDKNLLAVALLQRLDTLQAENADLRRQVDILRRAADSTDTESTILIYDHLRKKGG